MGEAFELTFSNGLTARVVKVSRSAELAGALRELSLRSTTSTLVLIGGAGELRDDDLDRLRPLFIDVMAPLAESLGASVVDGGTDAGVMRLMGQAHDEMKATFPLIGVAATGTVTLPGVPRPSPDAASLESHHTHFVLVPGSEWGDESPWLAHVASVLANGAPSVTVLVDGGETAWEDVSQSIEFSRMIVAIAGSGRTADKLVGTLRGETTDERARKLVTSGLLQAVEPSALAGTIERLLSSKEHVR